MTSGPVDNHDVSKSEVADNATEPDGNVVAVAKGASYLAAGEIFSAALRLVMSVFLARWLGADDYGLYILSTSLAFAASGLASLGLHTAMERHIAVDVRQHDAAAARGAIQVGAIGTLSADLVLAVALVAFAAPIANGLFDEPALEPLLKVSAVATPLLGLSTFGLASLRGFKRMDRAALGEFVIQPLSRFALLFGIAAIGMTPIRAGIAFAASYAIALGFIGIFLANEIGRLVGERGVSRDVRGVAVFAFPFWFTGVLRILRTRIQPLLLGIFGTAANIGVFSVVTSASMVGRIANASIRTALRPTLAELHDAGDTQQMGRLYATTTRWNMAANFPVFIVIASIPESLLGLFGARFETGVTPLIIVASAEAVNAATGLCGPIIAMSNHHRMKVANSFAWVTISIVANVLFIPIWGIIGAAIAILVSTTAINCLRVIEVWITMRILPWDRMSYKPFVAAIVTAAAGLLVLRTLPDQLGFFLIIAYSIGIAVVFGLAMWALGIEDDDRLVLSKIWNRSTRRFRDGPKRPGVEDAPR